MSNVGLTMRSPDAASGDGGKPPKKKRRFLRFLGWLVVFVVVVAIVVVGGLAITGNLGKARAAVEETWARTFVDDYSGEGTGEVTIVITQGQSVTAIGTTLQDAGVVASTRAFVKAVDADPSANLQPGTYALRQQMSGAAALALLKDPASKVIKKVTVPEGARLTEVLAISAKATGIPLADFEAAVKQPDTLGLPDYAKGNPEGFLYPATYEVQPKDDATAVLRMMVSRFNAVAKEIDLVNRATQQGRKPYDVVITASLVEAEAAPADFAKVARVVANRQKAGMPLQFDSTSNYASNQDNLQLTDAQKNADSPYNTYKNRGLPPTPINQPGKQALEASLNPATGDWLYFVTVNPSTKTTKFTASYQEFLKYVDELNAYLRASPSATR